MSYQKCPLCDGVGAQPSLSTSVLTVPCRVCQGAGIISALTGLPPDQRKEGKTQLTPKDIPLQDGHNF